MTTKERLQNAVAKALRARGACAHWDYEGDGSSDEPHACCKTLNSALHERAAAIAAVLKEQGE